MIPLPLDSSPDENGCFIENGFNYGKIPGRARFCVDQVGLELEAGQTQTLNDIGKGECYIRGAKNDMTKRLSTLQVSVNCFGLPIIKQAIIFKGTPDPNNPRKAPYIENKKITFNGVEKTEREHYDDRVLVYFQKKAWCDENVALAYLHDFHEETEKYFQGDEHVEYIALQQDNLAAQNTQQCRQYAFVNDIFLINTPEDCTDVVAVVDAGPGWFLKRGIRDQYVEHFEQNPERWCGISDDPVTAAEKRILQTIWLGNMSDKLYAQQVQSQYLTGRFKICGFYNDITGRENHLVEVRKVLNYNVRSPEEEKMEPLSKEECDNLYKQDRATRKAERERKRIEAKAKRIQRKKERKAARIASKENRNK